MGAAENLPWSKEEFERQLRAKGNRYHIHHPFHIAMNSGKCTREQVQGWVYNRFYYQISIPIKDAAVLSNMPDRDQRRQWIQRIIDHDGVEGQEGGIEAWLRLGEACGLKREEITSLRARAARRALRGGCLCQFRAARALAGSRVLFADRIVRAGDPQEAPGELAAALSVDRTRGL